MGGGGRSFSPKAPSFPPPPKRKEREKERERGREREGEEIRECSYTWELC